MADCRHAVGPLDARTRQVASLAGYATLIRQCLSFVPVARQPIVFAALSIAPRAKEPSNPIGYQVPQGGIVSACAVARTTPSGAVAYAARKTSHALSGPLALRTLSA